MSASGILPLPPLGLSPEEAASRFDLLQQKLIPLWSSIRTLNQDEQTIVVLPSITAEVDTKGAEMQAYEERFLFLLLLLRQLRARMIYITSQSILPSVIEYYLGSCRASSSVMLVHACSSSRRKTAAPDRLQSKCSSARSSSTGSAR